jgi:hypothetical protein
MLPGFDNVPAPLVREWSRRAAAPAFRAAHPDAAAAAARLAATRKDISSRNPLARLLFG